MGGKRVKRFEVIGLGLATVDILTPLSRLPQSDEVLSVRRIALQGGGPVATALVTLARFGARTAYLGAIAQDPWSRIIIDDFTHSGVDYSISPRISGIETSISVILVEENSGQRSILHRESNFGDLDPELVNVDLIRSAELVHLDGFFMPAAIRAASLAKQEGALVSLDGGAGEHWEGIETLLPLIDIMIVARKFATRITGISDPAQASRELKEYGAQQVIVTDGTRGSWYWDGEMELYQSAFAVDAQDTTGAGDVFHGAYLYAFLQDWQPTTCLQFASASAAIKCLGLGGRAGPNTVEQVQGFIGESG
jgi:sulfofructose kinase